MVDFLNFPLALSGWALHWLAACDALHGMFRTSAVLIILISTQAHEERVSRLLKFRQPDMEKQLKQIWPYRPVQASHLAEKKKYITS